MNFCRCCIVLVAQVCLLYGNSINVVLTIGNHIIDAVIISGVLMQNQAFLFHILQHCTTYVRKANDMLTA